MGNGPEDLGLEPVPAVARREEPVRRGRQQPRQRVLPEPDLDDHGAGLALVRLPRLANSGREICDATDLSRRDVIKLGAAATLTASLGVGELWHAPAQAPAAPVFFTPQELRCVDELSEMIIPTDEHSPGARAAKGGGLHRFPARRKLGGERRTWREGLKLVEQLSQRGPASRSCSPLRMSGSLS